MKQQRKPIKYRNPYYPRFNEDDEGEAEAFEWYNDHAQERDF